MVRNLHLFILLCGVLIALQGCINPLNIEEPEPEKGQFKVVLTSDLGQTKAFWEADPEKRKLGEPCERELHSVTILIYNLQTSVSYPPRHFTSAELKRGSSIFSLPEGTLPGSSPSPKISFHAFANYKFVDTTLFGVNLYGVKLGHISEYLNPTGSSTLVDINFSSIYPDGPAAPAVALRDVASGKGFVMTSLPVVIQISPTDDPNTPRTVNLKLARAVSRIEINAHTTPAFADKYPGSTLVITSLSMSYMPTTSKLCIFPEGNSPTVSDFITMRQQPNITTVDGLTHHNAIFYCYENTQETTTAPQQKPQLDIVATFDFDGDTATSGDRAEVKYSKKLEMSNGNGSIFRNTLYQVEVMLNGLTEREVISTIEILPWSTVYEEVHFGG